MTDADPQATEAFKALGDPVRWSIVRELAQVDELAFSTLEEILPLSKPAVSYHTRILTQAGLLTVRKQGRHYFYALRRELVRELVEQVRGLAPAGRGGRPGSPVTAVRSAAPDEPEDPGLLTW
ncbi:metalloregulator ArsR/SmtB family transcription factor [Amycolatopsis acidiphila]|uniref:Helix-turn-helix transcriptional regulator n=1 Tax=Amycolatopsis acidiphila TaxID=715473 RepID=A0A558AFJ3_9PSEU|nr:metalloregulator ArsR/SmtB family transcription factor [Amycolatopsis acidiphila]TVT23003.1 helix-turn-helix transcriptional regulator [Amycolatopsis acidiphila]UIJ57171.1 metalloregulator ArsR/SmtB family transcription factor [Amycolatopsis acidiphila]